MPTPIAIRLDPIVRFKMAHEHMTVKGVPIPFQVMRDYEDALIYARRNATGLHNKTITITRNASPELLDMSLAIMSDISIRVEGAKWR